MNKQIKFEGLNCAACADKIEKRINEIPWVEEVNLNFNMNSISLKLKKEDKFSLTFLQKLVDDIEDGVKLLDETEKESSSSIFLNRGFIRLLLSIPLFIGGLLIPGEGYLKVTILTLAYLISGYDVLLRAVKNLFRGRIFDEFFLMSIATIGAFLIGEVAEGVGVMIFFQLGEYIQSIAVGRTKKSIRSLMSIKPDFARLDGGDIVSPEEIKIGTIIEIRPGEKVPLDGVITSGSSSFDTKTITGESIPREQTKNDKVLSGFINISGVVKVKTEREFKDSTVNQILDMVQNENSKKTKTENFITKFARVYTPIVVTVAILIGLLTPLFLPLSYSDSIYKALIFLVISCPCALVIAVPLGYFGGIGRSSREGVLIKGSVYIDALTEVNKFAFDKTGTLTKGLFCVETTELSKGSSKKELLEAAYLSEALSNHPIARAITEYTGLNLDLTPDNYQEVSGKGIIATYSGTSYFAGNAELLKENGIDVTEVELVGTKVYIGKNSSYLGVLLLNDEIKEDSPELVRSLGDNIYMLTGDDKSIAKRVAERLGIKNFRSELLPLDKAEFIGELSKENRVLFVGDGINDAPVLARAHVGVSMGGIGSDAAIEASDVVFMNDKPSSLINAIKISKYTKRVIKENILIALGFKALIMVLGLMGVTGLWMAIFADVGVTLIAVLNSLKILNKNIK